MDTKSTARALAVVAVAPVANDRATIINLLDGAKSARAQLLDYVKSCDWESENSIVRAACIEWFMVNGASRKADAWIAPDMDEARRVIALAGSNSKCKPEDKRTKAQDDRYTSARSFWSAILEEAGLKTKDARGGANNTKPRGDKADKADAIDVTPKAFATSLELAAWIANMGKAFERAREHNLGLINADANLTKYFQIVIDGPATK
jgi:hypothetical protein